MLITTNQTITQWGHVFGDEMIAAAVLDRVLHHSHVLVIQGDSFRLRQKKRAGLDEGQPLNAWVGSVLVSFRGPFLMAFDTADDPKMCRISARYRGSDARNASTSRLSSRSSRACCASARAFVASRRTAHNARA